MTQQFGPPSIENLIDSRPVAQREDSSMICSHEHVPGFALIVVVVAQDRNCPSQISRVVVLFTSHIQADQVTRAHVLVQVVVSRKGGKRARAYGIVSSHSAWPKGGTMRPRVPACVLNHRFDAPLRYTRPNGSYSGH